MQAWDSGQSLCQGSSWLTTRKTGMQKAKAKDWVMTFQNHTDGAFGWVEEAGGRECAKTL